jgi:two-component system, cell cycle sensor histidine kinase and response regulator CckA
MPIRSSLVRGGDETILLVEDEPPLRQLARNILERYGYRILEAASGLDALEVWQQHASEIDLLLTDMVMPGGLTGRELALLLQRLDQDLKILYTSGYSLDFVESDIVLREGINFVPKPYSGTSLGQAVRSCLDRKR